MKKALFIFVVVSIVLVSTQAMADSTVDSLFRATATHDITDEIGIGPNGEMSGVTELTISQFMIMTTLYIFSREHWEVADKWSEMHDTYCLIFWAGTKQYGVCVSEKGSRRFVAIDRVL